MYSSRELSFKKCKNHLVATSFNKWLKEVDTLQQQNKQKNQQKT